MAVLVVGPTGWCCCGLGAVWTGKMKIGPCNLGLRSSKFMLVYRVILSQKK